MSNRQPNQDGFTLLELLVSLAVLSLIMVAMVSTLSTGRRVWERVGSSDVVVGTALVRERLRHLVESAPLPPTTDSADAILSGDKHSLTFLSFPDDGGYQLSQPVHVRLKLQRSESTGLIHVEMLENGLSAETGQAVEDTQSLGDQFELAMISYYGRISPQSEPDWHESWMNSRILPDLLKIEMVDAMGFFYPPLVVVPARFERQRYISLSSFSPPG